VALTISSSHFSQDSLSLNDAIEEIKARVQENELESLLGAAPFLYALGRNRSFLVDALIRETKRGPVQTIGLQDTSLILYHDAGLVIRANFWFPRDGFPAAFASRIDSFGYLIPHNHDFDFLTLGYWGPGYRTAIYECDMRGDKAVSAGDSVDLVFLENTALPEGKLMIYRAMQDVHLQQHPPEFSISLNVALLPSHGRTGQHLFDIDNKSVRAVLDHSRSQILACKLAAVLRDESLLTNLYSIRTSSTDPRILAAAKAAISVILNESNSSV
jgi:hypothetical protein